MKTERWNRTEKCGRFSDMTKSWSGQPDHGQISCLLYTSITSAASKPDKHCASHRSIHIFRIFLSLPNERWRCHSEALCGLTDVSVLFVGMVDIFQFQLFHSGFQVLYRVEDSGLCLRAIFYLSRIHISCPPDSLLREKEASVRDLPLVKQN